MLLRMRAESMLVLVLLPRGRRRLDELRAFRVEEADQVVGVLLGQPQVRHADRIELRRERNGGRIILRQHPGWIAQIADEPCAVAPLGDATQVRYDLVADPDGVTGRADLLVHRLPGLRA